MTETNAIEGATRRLAQALDALEEAVDRRHEADRGAEGLAAQLHALATDRSRLAADLDNAAARSRGLESANQEVMRRLDAAIETIRAVLAAEGPEQVGSDSGGGMTQVNVTINGRQFRMACEDGEEGHLAHLAEDLDARISRLRLRFGEIGDTRLTVMAALTLADELAEANKKLKAIEPELAAMQEVRAQSADRTKTTQAAVAAALNSAAERIERMAKRLSETVRDDGVAMG